MRRSNGLVVMWLVGAVLSQDVRTNSIDVEENSPFAEAAASILQAGGAGGGDLGGMVSSLLQSEGGKQLGGMLLGAVSQGDNPASQILSGLGAMLGQNNAGSALDPATLGNVMGMLMDQPKESPERETDVNEFLGLAGQLLTNSGFNLENSMQMLPQLLQTIGSFTGPEARARESEHSGHAWLLPPMVEKLHLLFDHFAHSELGKSLWKNIGLDKIYKAFSVDGKFNVGKVFEMLENHSFRRYWINQVVERITDVLAFVSDPLTHKKYISTGTTLFNSFLKTQGFPKSTHFDPTKPTETLTNFINYFFKKFLNYQPNAKQYVQPIVKYVQEVIGLAQEKGILRKKGINSRELSLKLTDTINLEIIEPVVRVYRAYRFAKKVPQCDKYVMCLVNQQHPHETVSIPGLKSALSKATSLFGSWFLSSHTGSPFLSLYSVITDEDDCSIRFNEKCNDFHIEEIKVTTEYQHNEL